MVGSYGLGGSLVSFQALDAGMIGGNLAAQVLGDDAARQAVEKILAEDKTEVTRLLQGHRYIIEGLRDALLEREELVEHEILDVIHEAEKRAIEGGDVVVDLRASEPVITEHTIELITDETAAD